MFQMRPMNRLSLLLLFPLPYAGAQEAAPAPARVEIQGSADQGDTAAAKRVLKRADIAAYGDSNLADVLKRQGGVSVVGNEVRMRGLGAGYTQILVDGAGGARIQHRFDRAGAGRTRRDRTQPDSRAQRAGGGRQHQHRAAQTRDRRAP